MNTFDEKYIIRLANKDDIPMVMEFIDDYWKCGHILARNREFMEYEFLEKDGSLNFILAIDRQFGIIEGIRGFLKASHNAECLDVWGVMWMTKPATMPLLGIELIKRTNAILGSRANIGVGDNLGTSVPLVKRILKRFVGKMNHYYMLSDKDEYSIAVVNKRDDFVKVSYEGNVIHYNSINELMRDYNLEDNKEIVPYKDEWYIDHRYFHHMVYTYDVCGINVDSKIEALFVSRREQIGNRYVVRIVDYIGKQYAIARIGGYFQKILEEPNCEYIDFYNLGFDERYIQAAGFKLRDEDDNNIIPNYFHPLVRENIDIWVSSDYEGTFFCKGDADQDRPN